MTLKKPFMITARLLPGLKIADGYISLEYSKRAGDSGRTRYHWIIDLPAGEFEGHDLQSGCSGGDLQSGFASLLNFLTAAGESYGYWLRTQRIGDNGDLFPSEVVKWAYQNSDELTLARLEIEEMDEELIEE